MPNWEYHFEEISGLMGAAEHQRRAAQNKVASLGSQGWEMVTIVADRGALWAAFKRPAEAPAAQPARAQASLKERMMQ